jgi:hypothetical protein
MSEENKPEVAVEQNNQPTPEELVAKQAELERQLREKEEIILKKDKAIGDLREKAKAGPNEDELLERLAKRVDEKRSVESVTTKVNALSGDEDERKRIIEAYDSRIQKTGDVERDLKAAVAIAESETIWTQRSNRALEERREDFITAFAGTGLRGEMPKATSNDPVLNKAAELVKLINPDAAKRMLGDNS